MRWRECTCLCGKCGVVESVLLELTLRGSFSDGYGGVIGLGVGDDCFGVLVLRGVDVRVERVVGTLPR